MLYNNIFIGVIPGIVGEFLTIENSLYLEKKARLLDGLDPESRATIVGVLNRYEMLAHSGNFNGLLDANYLTAAEWEYGKTTAENFYKSITYIGDCFECRGYRLPINHFETSVFLSEHHLDSLSDTTLLDDPSRVILDVGGFIGDSVLVFRKHFQNKIISFEATGENFALAQRTAELNNITNIVQEHLALGERAGTVYFTNDKESGNKENSADIGEPTQMDTLDNYARENNIRIGLIKVDIEGGEQAFLRGALETIKRDRPIMLLSIYHNFNDLFDIKPFIESLNLGYKFKISKPVDCPLQEILLICEPQG
ncbi:MAG: FkbM family methyltransferase [Rickettsiales bacterium]|jgi:FkbM family methyltransferase|nr:FkbM family methyltransferase [Rickettsiales bacterium]